MPRLIRQPNGLLALFCKDEQRVTVYNATPDEIVEIRAEEAAEDTRIRARRWIAGKSGRTWSVEEIVEEVREAHGDGAAEEDLRYLTATPLDEGDEGEAPREFFSDRGISLFAGDFGCAVPLLTVENCAKWNSMWLITPDGEISPVPFENASDNEGIAFAAVYGPYDDDIPNPHEVERLAGRTGWQVDGCALEMMWGRWLLRYHGGRVRAGLA